MFSTYGISSTRDTYNMRNYIQYIHVRIHALCNKVDQLISARVAFLPTGWFAVSASGNGYYFASVMGGRESKESARDLPPEITDR